MAEENKWQELAEQWGLPELDTSLLRQALGHASFIREQQQSAVDSNQRLEFLGDTVLDLIIAEHLYGQSPKLTEGGLTKTKARVVQERSLTRVAKELGLGEYLLLGHGEEDSGGRQKSSLLADALEAVIGAIYCSLGLEAARQFVLHRFSPVLAEANSKPPLPYDPKSYLQELLQAHTKQTPEYVTIAAEGPPHNRTFTVQVRFNDLLLGEGSGPSKQSAEQAAAQQALADKQHWLPNLQYGPQ